MEPLCNHSEFDPECVWCKEAREFSGVTTEKKQELKFDEGAGIEQGPFPDCECPSHHVHGKNGQYGCPVCNPGGMK